MEHRSIESIIGNNVAHYRETRGWKQSELGVAMQDATGKRWERGSVWAAESGKRAFAIADLLGLAEALGVQVPDLLKSTDTATVGDLPYTVGRIESLMGSVGTDDRANVWSMFQLAEQLQGTVESLRGQYESLVHRIRNAVSQDDELAEQFRRYLDDARMAQLAKLAKELNLAPSSEHLQGLVEQIPSPAMVAAHDALAVDPSDVEHVEPSASEREAGHGVSGPGDAQLDAFLEQATEGLEPVSEDAGDGVIVARSRDGKQTVKVQRVNDEYLIVGGMSVTPSRGKGRELARKAEKPAPRSSNTSS